MQIHKLFALLAILVISSTLFLTWNLRAPIDYILNLRIIKLSALIIVGCAIGISTVAFQTVTNNRLLTPGIVGFDSLYIFIQSMLVLFLGFAGYAALPSMTQFIVEALILVAAGLLLFGNIFKGGEDLLRLILVGIIIGGLLRGLSGFAQRLLDPSEFAIVQQMRFATFGAVDTEKLLIAGVLLIAVSIAMLYIAKLLDIIALGSTHARILGLHYDRVIFLTLMLISINVAISTALVGPVLFLGLLSASLAHIFLKTYRHSYLLIGSGLIGAIILVVGQFAFERVLSMQSTLAVIIELIGGLVFLFFVFKKAKA